MKNLISFITLLIFILNVSDRLIDAEAKDDVPDPVLDVDGNEVKTGDGYYISPTFRPGGGVTVYPLANQTRTYGVAQLVFGQGIPVTFSNGGTDLGEVVRESTDLWISFAHGLFDFSTQWRVGEYDEAAKNYFIVAGEREKEEATTINNRFQIRKSGLGSYQFAFCPKPCEFCATICTGVGIYINDEGLRRFALNQNFPSSFGFRKF